MVPVMGTLHCAIGDAAIGDRQPGLESTARKGGKTAADLVGKVYGRLTVLARALNNDGTSQRPRWLCRCICGRDVVILGASLRYGRTRSCGCLRAELARELVAAARAVRLNRRGRNGNNEGSL
jgi:hypothetical protein